MNHTQSEAGALAALGDIPTQGAPTNINTTALVMDSASMDKIMRVAEMMASGRSTVPQHLQKSPGDCLAVTMQAMQWGMNPFAVAQKTHVVNGALGYEAQLVNAVVQACGAIVGRFHYEHKGDKGRRECRVGAVLRGETAITWNEWLCEANVTTKNSPLWKTNPDQQLGYLQVKNWARAYAPGAILGVYTPDELEERVPRDMGPADVVSDWPADLLAQGREAAAKSAAAYSAFWMGLAREVQQKLVKTPEHTRFKDQAQEADRNRTVESPAPSPAPAPATAVNTSTGEITTTFADVEAKLRAAKNPDALAVALDWSNALGPDEQHRAGELLELHDQLKAAMQKGGAK